MKILFVDLDDTLLNTDKTVSGENIKAIEKMTKAGNALVLCTGRPWPSVYKLAKQYGFLGKNYYIASYNGALITDTADMSQLYHAGIDRKSVRLIFDEADRYGLPVQTYDNEHILVEKRTPFIDWYCSRIKMPYLVVEDVCSYLQTDPYKCVVGNIEDDGRLREFQKYISPKLPEAVLNLFSNPHLLEFGSKKATKGIAIEQLCSYLGLDIADSIAAGDEENDISMLETAGIGVAMINGRDSVKAAADRVTKNDNDHGGIREIIEELVLG